MLFELKKYFSDIRNTLFSRLDEIRENTVDLTTERTLRELERMNPVLKKDTDEYREMLKRPRFGYIENEAGETVGFFDGHQFRASILIGRAARAHGLDPL